jgi:hypothetical protein
VGAAVKNIEALIEDGGEITLGAGDGGECWATANDGHNSLAMLVRRDGETLTALLRRLDKAIAKATDSGDIVDEVNR